MHIIINGTTVSVGYHSHKMIQQRNKFFCPQNLHNHQTPICANAPLISFYSPHHDSTTHPHTQGNLYWPLNLQICTSAWMWWSPEHQEETLVITGRMCTFHTDWAELNPGCWNCDLYVRTANRYFLLYFAQQPRMHPIWNR